MIKMATQFILAALLGAGLMGCSGSSGGVEASAKSKPLIHKNHLMLTDNQPFNLPAVGVKGTLSLLPADTDAASLKDFNPGLLNFSNIQHALRKKGVPPSQAEANTITSSIDSLGLRDWRRKFVDMRLYKSIKMSQDAWESLKADIESYIPLIQVAQLPNGALLKYVGPDYKGQNPSPRALYAELGPSKIYYTYSVPITDAETSDSEMSEFENADRIYRALVKKLGNSEEK